jgi:hypothetical protein
MSQTNAPVFADFNKPATDLGVLKVVAVTLSTSAIGTAAHGLGYVPHFAIPVAYSSSNGGVAATCAQMNVAAVTASFTAGSGRGFNATNVYVVGVASADIVRVLVG